MVDVRKCFLVLALFALIAGGAFAQVQVTCTLGSANPLPIRDGGLTELVGTVQMSCANLTGAPVSVNFGVIMNTTVTNKLQSTTNFTTSAQISGTDPTGAPIAPVFGVLQRRPETGDVPNTRNQLVFGTIAVPTTVPNGTPVQLVISGIRVVAPPASTSFTPSTVVETITTSPIGAVNIPNPQSAVVGVVTSGLTADVRSCSNGSFSTANFAQCISEPSGGNWNANIRFTEAFNSSFKTEEEEGADAKNPTFLVAKFTNLPAGVKVFVTTHPVISTVTGFTAGPVIVPDAELTETTNTTDDTLGGLNIAAPGCTGFPANMVNDAALRSPATFSALPTSANWVSLAVTSGTAQANWAILADNQDFTDQMAFGILIVFTSNTAAGLPGVTTASGPAQVTAEFGPVAGPDSATSSGSQFIPRFRDNPVQTSNLLNITPCVTNLLFPYVTLGGGFDTGIAISNTSLDQQGTTGQPFKTTTQSGTCTAFYFTKPGATQVAPQTTDHAIAAGEVLAFALSQGGVPGATSTVPATFTGYMIVRCNFQFAHGFAFVSDLGAQKLAQGYLALVIPDVSPRSPRAFSVNTGNTGEILGN